MSTHKNAADWFRFGHLVKRRRIDLGIRTAARLGELVGVSARLIGEIENGRRDSYSEGTLCGIQSILGWTNIYDVISGAEPILVVDDEPAHDALYLHWAAAHAEELAATMRYAHARNLDVAAARRELGERWQSDG